MSSPSGVRRTCRAAGPTAATAAAGETSCWSPIARGGTWPRCGSRATTAPSAAATARARNKHGPRGEDLIVLVPPGTTVEGLDGERYDLIEDGQRAIIAAGGLGGHGNKRFTSATQQAPRFAERGLPGASGWIDLHLKLLADAGLVGLPNAGKSSLLARLTRAAPKVADYPFTTIEPVLGTIDDGERQLVLADIPGLIEGAADGAGLGHEFLAHVERCRVLVHLLEVGPEADPEAAYAVVRGELAAHGHGLDRLPELIALSKADLQPADEVEAAGRRMARAGAGGGRGPGDLLGGEHRPRRPRRRPVRDRRPRAGARSVRGGESRRLRVRVPRLQAGLAGRLRRRRGRAAASSRSPAAASRC